VAGFDLLLNVAIFDILRSIEYASDKAGRQSRGCDGSGSGDSTHPTIRFLGQGCSFLKSPQHDLGFIFGVSLKKHGNSGC
jgi:hypothetical protein